MSQETSPSDAALPARRRIIPLSERRVALPVAIIAHEGEERDQLEAQISRARPVVCFPSLAHFGADTARKERWAGIVVARTHAWDARLDTVVPRRAFIALFKLADEGYGWPDAVKRIGTPEELDAWLTELANPVLPADDRQRVMKPRAKRSVFTMSLAGEAKPARMQLTLPSLSVASAPKVEESQPRPATDAEANEAASQKQENTGARSKGLGSKAKGARAAAEAKAKPAKLAREAAAVEPAEVRMPLTKEKQRAAKGASKSAAATVAPQGLRLTSDDKHEQAVIDAVRLLGAAQARAIIDAVENFERD